MQARCPRCKGYFEQDFKAFNEPYITCPHCREQKSEWQKNNPEKVRAYSERSFVKNYKRTKRPTRRHTKSSMAPLKLNEIVYFYRCNGFVKIGKSTQEILNERLSDLQCGNPYELKLLATTNKYTERELHDMFDHIRVKREWFDLTDEIQKFINEL